MSCAAPALNWDAIFLFIGWLPSLLFARVQILALFVHLCSIYANMFQSVHNWVSVWCSFRNFVSPVKCLMHNRFKSSKHRCQLGTWKSALSLEVFWYKPSPPENIISIKKWKWSATRLYISNLFRQTCTSGLCNLYQNRPHTMTEPPPLPVCMTLCWHDVFSFMQKLNYLPEETVIMTHQVTWYQSSIIQSKVLFDQGEVQ